MLGPAESASSSASPPRIGQEVIRPPEGLARGVWELPPSAFYAALGALLLSCALYATRRVGLLRRKRLEAPALAARARTSR